jgi:hypothetical protein
LVWVVGLDRSDAAAYLGAGAGAALLMWLAVVALLAVATRTQHPEPQPAGLEPGGDEPPGVVNLLTHGWKVRGEALSATLVDLAARRILAFEQEADGTYLCRVVKDSTGLKSHERQVYDFVSDRATGGVVPFEALTFGSEDAAHRFRSKYTKEVVADARHHGLSRTRWSRAVVVLVGAVAVVPSVLAAGALAALPDSHSSSSSSNDPVTAFIGLSIFIWAALLAGFHWLRAERDTPEGLAAAGRWLGLRQNLASDGTFPDLPPTAVAIWDRYLAYAVALGVAARTEQSLPFGAESATEAWSSMGGRWRVVRIRYPRRIPPGWGRSPSKNAFIGLVTVIASVIVAVYALPGIYDAQADLVKDASTTDRWVTPVVSVVLAAVVVVLAVFTVRGLWLIGLGIVDIGRARSVKGRVLRVRSRHQHTYMAVDDGTSDHVVAWVTTKSAAQGSDVEVKVAGHVGFVRSVTVTSAPAPEPSAETAGGAPGEASLADLFTGRVAAGATPVPLDPEWVSSVVGAPVQAADGVRLEGANGLAVGALNVPTGAIKAFNIVSRLPAQAHEPMSDVGDESAWIAPISACAARRGDRGVLVFARGGTLDDARRREVAATIARKLLVS